jgi:CxxC motif-containing protein (DUF1111 family)
VVGLALLVGPTATAARYPAPTDLVARGAVLFATNPTPARGLGPLYNDTSCLACHGVPTAGGVGPEGLGTATRVGRLTPAGFDPLAGQGGPVARAHAVPEAGAACQAEPGIPVAATITSVRNAFILYGSGLIDAIPDEVIIAGAVPRGDGIHGRPHLVRDASGQQRVGRFGWKADTASLRQFVADAFRNELGITSPLAPAELPPAGSGCPIGAGLDDDGRLIEAVTAYLAALPPPVAHSAPARGAVLFGTTGCAHCHTPSLTLGQQQVPLYSDLLLHDVGPDLDDKVMQGQAGGRDWRTTPLWGLADRPRLLHDGRARTIPEAILAHGGEATTAVQRYRALSLEDREALLAFLGSL